MPKMLVYELYEVTADSPEDAKSAVEATSKHKKSVVVAAAALRDLAHPVHLAEAERAFGTVGMRG